MLYFLAFMYFIFFPILIVALLVLIYEELKYKKHTNQDIKEEKSIRRTHPTIKSSQYNNVFANRNSPYEQYKNEKGLYEPVTPSRGIKLNNKEEK